LPRFSAKVKEIHDAILFDVDLEKAKSLLNELDDHLDITIGKLFIAWFYGIDFHDEKKFIDLLTEIEIENMKLKDEFVQYLLNLYYFFHYIGLQGPVVNQDKAELHLKNMEQNYRIIDYEDEWEEFYCTMWYYNNKGLFVHKIRNNTVKAIEYQKRCIETMSLIPVDGKDYVASGHVNLGHYYYANGELDKAEISLMKALTKRKKSSDRRQLLPLYNLIILNQMKGNIQNAKMFNEKRLDIARQFNDQYGIQSSLTVKGSYLFQEGYYKEALETLEESLKYRKQHGDPFQIYIGLFDLFIYFYQRFKTSRKPEFLDQAEQKLPQLIEHSKNHPDHSVIVNYTKYVQAVLLKYGNMKKKVEAIMILEELFSTYPTDISIALELIELLFEDAVQSGDPDTIIQIDDLMLKIGQAPLRNNPHAVFAYLSQQVFLAKYNYYIKGDPELALEILNKAKSRVEMYKLENLVQELETEIQLLEKEITKWDNLDISVRDRIRTSEFSKYIQQAMEIAGKQM
jgi:tetratricopeptide (TPR) repeat protein